MTGQLFYWVSSICALDFLDFRWASWAQISPKLVQHSTRLPPNPLKGIIIFPFRWHFWGFSGVPFWSYFSAKKRWKGWTLSAMWLHLRLWRVRSDRWHQRAGSVGGREHRLSPASRTENARNARNARDTEFRSQQWPVLSRGSRFSGLFGCAVCLGGPQNQMEWWR